MWAALPRSLTVEGAEKVVARDLQRLQGCFHRRRKCCLNANGNEPGEGEGEFTEQKRAEMMCIQFLSPHFSVCSSACFSDPDLPPPPHPPPRPTPFKWCLLFLSLLSFHPTSFPWNHTRFCTRNCITCVTHVPLQNSSPVYPPASRAAPAPCAVGPNSTCSQGNFSLPHLHTSSFFPLSPLSELIQS